MAITNFVDLVAAAQRGGPRGIVAVGAQQDTVLEAIKQELRQAVAGAINETFGVEHDPVVEIPPRRELGDLAFPAGLHLARVLKRNPRAIAEELAAALDLPDSVREVRHRPGALAA